MKSFWITTILVAIFDEDFWIVGRLWLRRKSGLPMEASTLHDSSVPVEFFAVAGLWMPFVPAAEVQRVQSGSTVTLGCNISYLYDTTWLKHNTDLTPTVVLCASLREGRPFQGFQLNPRFSVELMNRSLALKIAGVEEGDLGLYYCIANVNTRLMVGRGTMLQASSPDSSWFLFHHWYCVVVGFALLIMVLAVCITHWKAKSSRETTNRTRTANRYQKD